MKKIIFFVLILAAVMAVVFSGPVLASVSGPCANCHTMHNSQGGTSMVEGGGAAQETLLTDDCVGCHTGTNNGSNTIPYVYSTGAPTYGTNTLAGGNFYWVKTDDAKGHNVFASNPDSLTQAPGDIGFSGCVTGCCHGDIHGEVGADFPVLEGRQGCTKCHMVGSSATKGYHHADDSNLVVGSDVGDTDGFYRFLSGHMSGGGHGVCGIEDDDWNYGATVGGTDHNEYLGSAGIGGYGFSLGHTTTAYCTGCHGAFHANQKSGGNWIRHPSDAVIPDSGEYAGAFGGVYDPDVPVARASLAGGVTGVVTAGSDMVMCRAF